jgi:hypothetical protein
LYIKMSVILGTDSYIYKFIKFYIVVGSCIFILFTSIC